MNSYKVLFITLLLPVWPEANFTITISADFFFSILLQEGLFFSYANDKTSKVLGLNKIRPSLK